MKKIYKAFIGGLLMSALAFSHVQADIPQVTIRDLNTYDQPLQAVSDVQSHPMVDSLVEFTAVVSSYPRNSGLASYNADTDGIGRIHVFVIDTTALSEGRDGMGMQLVVSGAGMTELETLDRGDVITIRGALDFFGNIAQFDSDDINQIGSIWFDPEFEKYQSLMDPWVISLTEINEMGPGGVTARLENYTKYHSQYVKVENGVVINRDLTSTRPWMYFEDGGVFAYNRDTSLRYRNDRNPVYRAGYNYRRLDGADGLYEPPPPGAVINYSGYVVINTFDGDNVEDSSNPAMAIVAMEDGVRWVGERNNAVRYTNDNLPAGAPYQIPNDLEVIGFPPVFTNYSMSNQTPTSTEQVAVSVDINPADEGTSVTNVELSYWVDGVETVETLSGSGSTYSYTFPTFDDLTSVSFEIRATDSNDITGTLRDGNLDEDSEQVNLRFFVLDSAIDNIELITKTSDGGRGQSPLYGMGELPVDVTAVVVADSSDGYIVVHDKSDPWSGVFLEPNSETHKLRRGDQITITQTQIGDTSPTSGNFAHITFLIEPVFDVVASDVDYTTYIPTLTTNDLSGQSAPSYEAMVVRVEGAYITTNQPDATPTGGSDFGEWAFASGTPADGNPAVRVRNNVAQDQVRTLSNFGTNINDDIKPGSELVFVQGVLGYSHGNQKITLRSLEDVEPVENMFYPSRIFPLFVPSNNAELDVNRPLFAQWASSIDRDGDDLKYFFLLSTPGDVSFENYLIKSLSNNDGENTDVTIPYNEIDSFLAGRGLDDGDSETFIWTIWVTDSRDTVQVSTKTGPHFSPMSRTVTLKRNTTPTSADDSDLPKRFALEQNYPNPFNPTTKIQYDVPNEAHVNITIYDVLGRQVLILVNEELSPGTHTATFDGTRLASGVYIYRMEAGSFVQTRKMMFIK